MTADLNRVVGLLREIREECQNLQEALAEASTIADAQPIFESMRVRMLERIGDLRTVMHIDSGLFAQFGDVIVEIENRHERVCLRWPDGSEDPPALAAKLAQVNKELDRIIYSCALITVPERVNRNLAALRIGQGLDFNMTFVDELPKKEQRAQIFDFLCRHPKLIDGLLEPDSGQVRKIAPEIWRRYLSFCMFAGAALLPIPALWAYFRVRAAWPDLGLPAAWGGEVNLIVAYAMLLTGSLVHIGILALKQSRSRSAGTVRALKDWILWFHVNEMSILFGAVTVWVALAGLAVMTKGPIDHATAFFVGYSVDSFVDLFLQRFESTASRVADSVRSRTGS